MKIEPWGAHLETWRDWDFTFHNTLIDVGKVMFNRC